MDRSFQFDSMIVFTPSPTIVYSVHPLFCQNCALTTTNNNNEKKHMMFFSYLPLPLSLSPVWTSSGILYILSSSWWYFFRCCCRLPQSILCICSTNYKVHPHCFRINSIFLLYSSLFVCYSIDFVLFFLTIFILKRTTTENLFESFC